MTITEPPGYKLYEYSCHEGNTAVNSALSGERAYDRSVAEARAKGLPIPERHMSSPYGPPSPDLEVTDINRLER